MKKLLIIFGLAVIFITTSAFSAFNFETPSFDSDRGTKVSLWIPGFAFKIGSLFVNKHDDREVRHLLKKIKSLKVFLKCATNRIKTVCVWLSKSSVVIWAMLF